MHRVEGDVEVSDVCMETIPVAQALAGTHPSWCLSRSGTGS